MDLSPYLSSLREDLNTTASAGDDDTKRAAAVLSAALEPAARLAIMNALSDLAAEVTSQLDGPVVDVRLDGRDVRVVISDTGSRAADAEEQASGPPPPPAGGDISRMTLRLFEELKDKAEQAATEQGVSLNSWVQQAVQGALHGAQKGGPWGPGRRGPGPRRHGPKGYRRWDDDDSGDELHGWVRP